MGNMDNSNKESVEQMIDHQRWLMNNGLSNDIVKDQLYLFGAIVHKDIQAVELDVDFSKKLVSYKLYADRSLLKKISKFNTLSKSNSIFGLWRLKRLVKSEGNLNFASIVRRFVGDYLGPKWNSTVEIKNIAEYVDGYAQEAGKETV